MVRERGIRPEDLAPPAPLPAPSVAELPIDWMKLDDAERSEILLSKLIPWVPELVRSYMLKPQIVVPCWYLHEEMIHEVLALYQYREQQQFNLELGPPASAPIDFQYQLGLWKHRMTELTANAGCTQADHHRPTVQAWADVERPESATWSVTAEEFAMELAADFAMSEAADSSSSEPPTIRNGAEQ